MNLMIEIIIIFRNICDEFCLKYNNIIDTNENNFEILDKLEDKLEKEKKKKFKKEDKLEKEENI